MARQTPADTSAAIPNSGNGNGEPHELSAARWWTVVVAMLFVALVMFVFEFIKTVINPTMTIWVSHSITIVFATGVGTFATWFSLRRLDRLHWRLLREEEKRVQLQERSNHLAERAQELEVMNDLLAKEIEERRHVERQLVHAQKMESIGRLAGGIAHDFNNLLSVIIGGIDLVRDDLGKPESASKADIRADLDSIRDASMRAARLTRQLLTFARHQPHEPRIIDLHDLIRSALPVMRRLVGETIEVCLKLDAPISLCRVDPAQIEQVLFNLVGNAADAMPDGGRLSVSTRATIAPPSESDGTPLTSGHWIAIDFADSGTGIPANVLPHLFEPFFTTKPVGKGTGLGLATSYGIVSRSAGTIEASNNPTGGATFRVTLPVVEEAPQPAERASPTEVHALADATVLLVEDEPRVREIARRVLEGRGYIVLLASDGAEAIDVADRHDGDIDMLLTDVVMPRMGGRALSEVLRGRRPTLRVLYMSGYTDVAVVGDGMDNAEYLQKPFTADLLLARVAALLKSAEGVR